MRIPLKVQGVTDITASKVVSLLIVTDTEETRQLTIMIAPKMRYEFALRRGKYVGNESHRTAANDYLQYAMPETFSAIIKYLTDLDLAVIIVGLHDGEYRAVIEDRHTGTSFNIRACDGILLSYADPHIPLYIENSLWEAQSVEYLGVDAKGVSMPLNTLPASMLKQAMQKCIEEEKYEIAEQIKREMERRK